jgi:NitT/TauT family transport system substrate-binding protein
MKYFASLACITCVLQSVLPLHSAAALDRITVAIGGYGLGETGICERGQMQGIFSKRGIQLEILYTAGTGETQQAVIANSANIGITLGVLGVVGAYSKGAPLRIIGASFTGASDQFWYVTAQSPIQTARDTAGRTVAYSTNGSSTQSAVLQMQKHLGVPFKPIATGSTQVTYTQVMSGQVDVGWASAPFLVDDVENGKLRLLWRASDVPALAHQITRVIVANSDYLRRNKELVARFMDAYREAAAWLLTPEGIADYAIYAKIPLSAAKRTMQDFVTAEAIDPDKISDIEGAMQTAVELKYLPAPLTKEQLAELIQLQPRRQ